MTLYLFTLLSLLCLSAASGEVDDSIGNPCNEDNVIVEGDIAIPQHEYLQRRFSRSLFRRRRAVTNDADKLWPNATIPFEISKHLGSYAADVILQAMDHWEEHTCIHFVPHSDEQDYVEFVKGKCGCCSYVGRRGDGRQLVSLQVFCTFFGVIVHEIGHVIGFWHEHNRPDRDKFVDILYDNVEKHHKVHFEKKSPLEINSFGQAYDYNSIMHYPRKTFSKDGKDTILPLMHNVDIGQREELSESDVIQARELYQCPIPECNQNLTEPTGVIKSPYYPYNYPQNHICEWVIHAPPDHQILLEFQSFDIEYRKTCLFDYLEVRLGTDSSAQLYDIYCGDELPEPIVSKEGGIWLKFHSDETIVKTGFEAKYYIDSLESSGSSFTWSGSGDPIFPIGSGDSAWTTEFIKYFGPHPTSVESTTTQAPCKQVCLFFHFCFCQKRFLSVLHSDESAPDNTTSNDDYSGNEIPPTESVVTEGEGSPPQVEYINPLDEFNETGISKIGSVPEGEGISPSQAGYTNEYPETVDTPPGSVPDVEGSLRQAD